VGAGPGVGGGVGVGVGEGLGVGVGAVGPEWLAKVGVLVVEGVSVAVVVVLASEELSVEAPWTPPKVPRFISLPPFAALICLGAGVVGVLSELSKTSASNPPHSIKAIAAAALPSILYFRCHSLIAVRRRRLGIQTP
ncbi:MAG TPA: hypothetical protein VLE73_03165, partial [Candidatus Saccharimonadales bacterium]|nr:hypothetical protein [Candidatus Saccharimonadales bacterium]